MGKGKTQQAPADQTIRQTNLPEYADPYFRRLLQGAEEAMMPFDPATGRSTYTPYPYERIAASSNYADINAARAATRDIAGSGIAGLPEAQLATKTAMTGLEGISQYGPGAFSQFGGAQEYQYQQPGMFTGQAVQQYMSPYMQNVVDIQKREAERDFFRGQAGRSAQAVQAGAFGGSRQAVQEALAQEELSRQQADIQARGQQQAFEQAATQFGADRAAQMETEQRRAAEAGRVQGIGYEDLARRQAALEQSRQFGAGQGLAGYQALASTAAGLAGLGQTQRAADIQGAQLLETIGRDIRAEDQARLDLAYEDFARQRDYPMRQYERFAGILSGVPVTPDVDTQRFVSYNPTQQALGAGLSALGLYKGLTT